MREITDVLDEIKIIKSVLHDQIKVMESKTLNQLIVDTTAAVQPFAEVQESLNQTQEDIDAMKTHAKAVEEGLKHLLDLKQKQANLWEARSSREGAEEAAKQGNTLMIFTVVTIIFLPLSFMASLFALGIAQFPKDKTSGNTNWQLHYVCGLLFGISFAVSIPFILLAFNITWFTAQWNQMRHVWLKMVFIVMLKLEERIYWVPFRVIGLIWHIKLFKSVLQYALPIEPGDRLMQDAGRHIAYCRPESGCRATRLSYLPLLDSVSYSLLRTPAPTSCIYSFFSS